MNKYIATGNLTKDRELKYLPNGTALLSFDIAVNTKISKDKTETCYWKCKIFGKGAEALNPYLNRGQKVLVDARVVDNTWTKQDGTKQYSKELIVEKVELLGSKSDNKNNQPEPAPPRQRQAPLQKPAVNMDEEDIPF